MKEKLQGESGNPKNAERGLTALEAIARHFQLPLPSKDVVGAVDGKAEEAGTA